MNLAFTLDYELFGNGSGHVFKDLINPTNDLLTIFSRHKINITIFFEVVEYWRLKEEWEKGNNMNYQNNPAESMRIQIINAFKAGHDVQLHIHPQWINAKFDEVWKVDSNWCMKDIPLSNEKESEYDLYSIIKKGKEMLEEWLKPIDQKYSCNIFRAGAFNILPSERVFPILRRLKFIADSSVYAGGYEINKLSNIDYRDISNQIPYWYCNNDDVLNQSSLKYNHDLIELPIFSMPFMRFRKYDLFRLKGMLKNKKSSYSKFDNRIGSKSLIDKIKYFFEQEYITWDFCLNSSSKWRNFYYKANRIKTQSEYSFHPFILIGHSKSLINSNSINQMLRKAQVFTNYWTLTAILNKLNGK